MDPKRNSHITLAFILTGKEPFAGKEPDLEHPGSMFSTANGAVETLHGVDRRIPRKTEADPGLGMDGLLRIGRGFIHRLNVLDTAAKRWASSRGIPGL